MLGRKGPFIFEGITLGEFVNEMARRAGENNVYVQIHTEENNEYVFDITVGIIMPVPIKGSMVKIEFTFEAQQQGFNYQLKLTECELKDNHLAILADVARPDIGIVPAE
jgi:NDP-sugar pyrophosphorylase family protein